MSNNKCKLCNKSVGKKIKLFCGQCRSHVHLECGNVSEVDARLMLQERKPWTCEVCSEENNRSTRRSTTYSVRSPNTRDDCFDELKSMLRVLQNEVREMRTAMDFINEKYEEERKRNKIMADMFSEISKDNQILKEKVKNLEAALSNQENDKIRRNICVTGLINNNDEKVVIDDKLSKLFTHLSLPTSKNDFELAKKYNTGNGTKVVLTVANSDLRERILRARSQKKNITAKSAGLGESDSPIYIGEEMTKETYKLFKKAKGLKGVGFRFVWYRNGKILARKREGDDLVVIKGESQLNDLLSD